MADSVIKGVAEELGELGKKTGETLVKEVKESGKDFVKAFIGMSDASSVTKEEFLKKKVQQSGEDQKKLAAIRRNLPGQMSTPATGEQSLFEQKKQEEIAKKQRQTEMAKQKQAMQLPQTGSRPRRGSLLAFKKRKQNQVEMGKSPGQ